MKLRFLFPLLACAAWLPALSLGAEAQPLRFKKIHIDPVFRSEGAAVGDFNKDGKKDIAAGYVWYPGPDFKDIKPVIDKIPSYEPRGYSNSFCCFVDDLNADGWDDIIVVDFPGKETWWFENNQNKKEPWKRHVCVPETNNESPTYLDIDGDGKRELLFSASDRFAFARPAKDFTAPWEITYISHAIPEWTQRFYHGIGAGDVNKDGRTDIVIPHGWFEAPKDSKQKDWAFHKYDFGQTSAQMYVFDVDGDGDNDILASCAHRYGLWWLEQGKDGEFTVHEIDKSISETHSLVLVDMNGDKLPDLVTGKRFWSHFRGEPGSDDSSMLVWWELSRKDGKPSWTKRAIDSDSGVGTQFEVTDVNGDGLLDVVSSNKKGTHYLQQVK